MQTTRWAISQKQIDEIRQRLTELGCEEKTEPFVTFYRQYGHLPLDDPDAIWISVTFHRDPDPPMGWIAECSIRDRTGEPGIERFRDFHCYDYTDTLFSAGRLAGRRFICRNDGVEWESEPGENTGGSRERDLLLKRFR